MFGANTTYVWLQVYFNNRYLATTQKRVVLNGYMVTYFEALISMTNGNVLGVTWANQENNLQNTTSCSQCNGTCCIDGFCGATISSFNCSYLPRDCDTRVYLGFVGSDAGGASFTSNSNLPSAFQLYSWGPIWLAASSIANDFIYGFTNQAKN